jgi:NAD(P)-dependent dehydrogenase (short-subunit alcohol dehydrogenase family)
MGERLRDRVALVFGAGAVGEGWSNGRAAAVAYAREGAQIFAVDLDLRSAEETAAIIRSEGGRVTSLAADVTDEEAVSRAVAQVLDTAGHVDILHNNVGFTRMGGPVEVPFEEWNHLLALNTAGVYLACRHVLPGMVERKRGAVINISSVASVGSGPYPQPLYTAAKAAVNGLTRGLAARYAPSNVRINAIMPGVMDTPLIHQQIAGNYADREAMMAGRHARAPMGFMGTAWDVANAAVFLASDEARYITGVVLPVDGGLTCTIR